MPESSSIGEGGKRGPTGGILAMEGGGYRRKVNLEVVMIRACGGRVELPRTVT